MRQISGFVYSPSLPAARREKEYLPINIRVESRSWLAYLVPEIRSLKEPATLDTVDWILQSYVALGFHFLNVWILFFSHFSSSTCQKYKQRWEWLVLKLQSSSPESFSPLNSAYMALSGRHAKLPLPHSNISKYA